MKFQVGDCMLAARGAGEEVALVYKASDVSSDSYPDRCVFSVRFQIETETTATFVWQGSPDKDVEGQLWVLPDETPFEPRVSKITRGSKILWEE